MNLKESGLIKVIIFLIVIFVIVVVFLVVEESRFANTIAELETEIEQLEKTKKNDTEVTKQLENYVPMAFSEPERITHIIQEYYDGKQLFDRSIYTNVHKFNESEIDRIVQQWNSSGYDYIFEDVHKEDGIEYIDLFFEHRDIVEDEPEELVEVDINSDGEWSEYDWLLHCVAAENGETYDAAWWTASCIVNRAEYEYGSIEAAVTAPGQFSVYSSGSIYTRPVYDCAVEAVNAVLNGDRNYEVYFFSAGNLHDREILHVSGNEYFYR